MASEKIALTQTAQKGGCAAKVSATELRKILHQVKFPVPHAELMIDGRLFDDAAIYKVTDDIAL
ncbi:MAG TPA: selenide, water dikinase SelD, partial [Bdellovibrio sp.]|nr:selenide, water dikinase SelD [Bdellovibrio sp.]